MKVAVLMSGAFRNLISLSNIKKNIIDPLNADVFIATWDSYYPWMGIDEFHSDILSRCFEKKNLVQLQLNKDLFNSDTVKKYLPNLYKKLSMPVKLFLPLEEILKELRPKKISIYNEQYFENNIQSLIFSDNINQLKMFYLLNCSFRDMISYSFQKKNKYDVCIRIRPDLEFESSMNCNDLFDIEKNYVFCSFSKVGGLSDAFFYSEYLTMKKICTYFLKSLKNKKLSIFNSYKKIVAHDLLLLVIISNNILTKTHNLKFNFIKNTFCSLPDLQDCLKSDYKIENQVYKNDIRNIYKYLYKIDIDQL